MTILTESDVSIYAPSVTLSGDALLGAILNAQYQIESAKGANRPLEITQFIEQKHLNYNQQTAYLSYQPLIITDLYPMEVKVRIGNEVDVFGYGISPQEWQILDSSNYILDNHLGRVNLNLNNILTYYSWWGYFYQNTRAFYTEIQISYYSGFDFTDNTNLDVLFIKSMCGQVLSYLQSPSYQGVKRLIVPFREFEIEYNNSIVGEIPKELFTPLWKYRPIIN